MNKLILVFICCPLLLFAQEQVTNISQKAVYEPSFVNELVGFTEWDGETYMFTEGDTLSMYTWKDTFWVLYNTLPKPKGRTLCRFLELPTRSKLLFQGNIYCRTFANYLQLIDIKSGDLISQHDLSPFNIKYQKPLGIFEENYFFYITNGGKETYYRYDINLEELEELFVDNSTNKFIMRGSLVAGVNAQGKIMIYDAKLKKDTILKSDVWADQLINYSIQDSMFNFAINGNESIIKVNQNLEITEFPCYGNVDYTYTPMFVYGQKVLTLKSYVNQYPRQDSILVYDLKECEVLYTFKTDTFGVYVKNIDVHESNDLPENTSIIGFYGFEPGDGIENIYYFINDKRRTYTSSRKFVNIEPFNSIEYKGDFYFVCSLQGVGGHFADLIKYDPISGQISHFDPENKFDAHTIQLGLVKNDRLIFALNGRAENPAIYTLDSLNKIKESLPLQFLKNMGVSFIKDVYSEFNDLYFKNGFGVYSLQDSGKLVISFDRKIDILNNEMQLDVAVFDNKIAVSKYKTDTIIFEVYDAVSGKKDTIEKFLSGVSVNTRKVGPFIFFNNYVAGGHLHAYNYVTNKFYEYPNYGFLGTMVREGEFNALISANELGSLTTYEAHIFDYDSGSFTKTAKNYATGNVRIFSGQQGSFYIVNNGNNPPVELLKENGEVSTISNPSGYFSYNFFSRKLDDGKTTVLGAHTYNTCYIIANDLEHTVITTLSSRPKDVVLLQYKNTFLLETDSNGVRSYYLYEPFKELTLLKKTKDEQVVLYDIRDSLVVLVFYKNDKTNNLLLYDRFSKTIEQSQLNGMPCWISPSRRHISFEPSKFVLDLDCGGENEPWILDVKTQTLELLKDIKVGNSSSYPDNFNKHKEYVYFTAYIEDFNRQWFRMDAKGDVSKVETEVGQFSTLSISPIPSGSYIQMNADLSSFAIYNQEGKRVLEGIGYRENSLLSIANLISGLYYVMGMDKNQKIQVGKFLVVKN